MSAITEPLKFTVPFAETGLKNAIPATANNATGKAGFDKGFPERTMLPKASGGIPPSGMDFNGILYDITSAIRYMQAGGKPTYDSSFASAIGGYPLGAVLIGDDGVSAFQNSVAGNETDPNSGGAGWTRPDLQAMELYRRSYAEAGYNVVGTFQAGFTLVNASDVGIDLATGKGYTGPAGPVAAGTDPASGGFVDVSDASIRGELSSTGGASIVNTSSGDTVQQEIDALKSFSATGANVPYPPQYRARRQLSASDFTPQATDLGAAVNAVRTSLETEYSPSSSVGIRGGDCELPRGTKASLTPINLERHASGTTSFNIRGQGQATTQLDMMGAPALTDGISGGVGGATFGELSDFSIKSAPRSGTRLGKYSRMTLRNLDVRNSGADGYYLGNGFVSVMEKLTSNFNASNGFNFDVALQHTSHAINGGYAFQNGGSGWAFGLMNYCSASALASDNNTLYGYGIAKCDGFVLDGCGAESNGRSAFAVLSSTANGATKNTTINNAFAYHNNLSNTGYPNLLYALAANGEAAHVRISKSKSIPNVGDTTKDIIADGVGAEIEIDDCEMPNGWASRNGGYIHWRHKTLIVRGLTIPVAPTATPICNLLSTQGHKARYAGRITVLASNQQPSTGERNTAIYELLVSKSVLQGTQVVVIAEAGMVAGASTSGQSQPAFDFSLVNDQLVVTPRQSTGGVPFWFEIDTSSQIVAMPL